MESRDNLSVGALHQILDAALDGVVKLDREWRITFANRRAEEWTDKSSTVLGEVFWNAFAGLLGKDLLVVSSLRRAIEEGVASEMEAYYPGPNPCWTRVIVQPASDGVIVFLRDASLHHEDRLMSALAPGTTSALCSEAKQAGTQAFGPQGSVLSLMPGRAFHLPDVFDLVHDAIISTDLQGIITGGNQNVEPLYGHSAECLAGTHLASLFPEEYRHALLKQLREAMLSSGKFEGQICNLPSATGERDINFSAVLVFDQHGQAAGMLTFSSLRVEPGKTSKKESNGDKARQLQALELLEESSAIMRTLVAAVEHAQDAVLITEAEPRDEPGPRILYVNEAFTRMTGYTPGEVIGRTPRILQGPRSDRAAIARMHEALASWKPVREELINYRKDGTEFHVDLSIVPVADQKGSFTHWVSIQRETTEQNGVRAALQESESRLRTLMDALPQLLWTADAQGCCTYVSESYCQFLGVRSEGCMGLRWIDCVHPEDRERVIATWNDALMRKTTFITEYRLVRHDGAYRWFLHRALPGLDAAGNVVEWIGTLN